jgi:hypothetical protein
MSSVDDVLNAVVTCLGKIRTLNGYRTDAGANPIYRGRERIDDEHDAPVFSVFIADESLTRDRANVHVRDVQCSVLIAAWVRPKADDDQVQPLLDILADVKKAVFNYGDTPEITAIVTDHYYEGASFMPRQDGGTFAQVVVEGVFKWRETV